MLWRLVIQGGVLEALFALSERDIEVYDRVLATHAEGTATVNGVGVAPRAVAAWLAESALHPQPRDGDLLFAFPEADAGA